MKNTFSFIQEIKKLNILQHFFFFFDYYFNQFQPTNLCPVMDRTNSIKKARPYRYGIGARLTCSSLNLLVKLKFNNFDRRGAMWSEKRAYLRITSFCAWMTSHCVTARFHWRRNDSVSEIYYFFHKFFIEQIEKPKLYQLRYAVFVIVEGENRFK